MPVKLRLSISSFASHFLSSPEKLLKHGTNQFFFSLLDVRETFSTTQRSRQLGHGLTANPRDVLGLGIRREHCHLSKPAIRHVLFWSRSLPPADIIQPLLSISTINKVNFITPMLSWFPSLGNITITLSMYIRHGNYHTPFAYISGNPI